MYTRFGLTLMVTHACNLRCTYCYTVTKRHRRMPLAVGRRAIDNALASLAPGGVLDLGFFGGEPLLEADLIADLMAYASRRSEVNGSRPAFAVTTNGTVTTPAAWAIMNRSDVDLSVSCDGDAMTHDAHRFGVNGKGSAASVHYTIRRLSAARRDFLVVMVVRPDNAEALPGNVAFLQSLGVRRIQPSLDLWTHWNATDVERLNTAVAQCADLWRAALPELSLTWFDEKAARLAAMQSPAAPRCGFGNGEIAVTPAGRLYPCERLIGEDGAENPMAIKAELFEMSDFLNLPPMPGREHASCSTCAVEDCCNTFCRCSNYVRTGDVSRPDGLLCAWNQACITETARVLGGPTRIPLPVHN